MLVSDFDYHLPAELIAQEPLEDRGGARMMVLNRSTGMLEHRAIADLPEYLHSGTVLALNNTRVVPARLLGRRMPSGGAVECVLLARVAPDQWDALMHPGQKLRIGERVVFERGNHRIHGEVLERHFYGRRRIRLWPEPDGDIGKSGDINESIEAIGDVPLPPYIKRPVRAADRERYQTVFARVDGSVAAPTAGLHFTPSLLASLRARGVTPVEITLHVGYGTFAPVRTEVVEEHRVEPETYHIDEEAAGVLNRALGDDRLIAAVGTTTVRTLEAAFLAGGGCIPSGTASADLFIHPGFQFAVTRTLLTNFHLPRSSLLMLVCAFAGREPVLAAYREAVARGYRFYSYGDAMLIL
jgi:S-adenosylmethionine:tRNA ribosyltransferase-isomerase